MNRTSTLSTQVRILQRTIELCSGRVDTRKAEQIVQHVDSRLALRGDYTTVAVAGATGSGKSTTVNALVGSDLMRVSLRRPTTSVPIAAVGNGGVDPGPLLDWLGIVGRHEVTDRRCRDLILIDMPDTDSFFRGNRLEVDRLVDMVDLIVWVVDPQKYADRVLHEDYLQRLAPYASVMLVVLNRIDELSAEEVRRCHQDLRRLLNEDGLAETPIVAASAASGNVTEIRDWIVSNQSSSMLRRLEGDVARAAADLDQALGKFSPRGLSEEDEDYFVHELAEAVGVPNLVDKVGEAWALRSAAAAALPFAKLRRLFSKVPPRATMDVLPAAARFQANATQQAKADTALRRVTSEATLGLPRPWAQAAGAQIWQRRSAFLDRLDQALVEADIGVRQSPWWWRVVSATQWLLLGAVLGGLIWWGFGVFGLAPLPVWGTVPWPPILAVLAALLAVAVAGVGRMLAPVSALRKARGAEMALVSAVREVAGEEVLEVLGEETDRFSDAVATLARLRGRG